MSDEPPMDASPASGHVEPFPAPLPSSRWLSVAWRILGLGVVIVVLASQIHWHDRITLGDGTTLEGEVTEVQDAEIVFETLEGATSTHALRQGKDDKTADAVSIHYGLSTLSKRLGRAWGTVLLVLLGLVFLVVLTAWRWHLLLHAARIGMSFLRAVQLTFVGGFFNLAVPGSTGGDVVKAVLTSRYTGAATRSVLSIFADRVLGLLGLIVLAGSVLLIAPPDGDGNVLQTSVIVLLVGALVFAAFALSPTLRRVTGLAALGKKLPIQGVVREARECARLYAESPWTLVTGLLIGVANHAIHATAVWVLAGALDIDGVTFARAIALVPLANLVSAIPILPGGWGVGEAAFAYFFGTVGVPATEAVALSVVYRLAVLASNLPGGVLWMGWRGKIAPGSMQDGAMTG